MKKIYITNDEYERAEYEIYNDIPLSLASNTSFKGKALDERYVEEVLIEGEQWVSIEEKPEMVLTSYSRLLNTHSKKIIKPAISSITVYWTIGSASVRCLRDFPKNGWKYDHKEQLERYLDLKWPLMRNGHKYIKGELGYLFKQRTI
jgi:hypothetical protein